MSNTFSRRHFLQYGMAAIAGGTALGGLPVHAAQAPAGTAASQNDLVKGYCPFCQVRCTYHARVRNGKILELIGDRGNRWTGGAMCPKGLSIVELLNSPYRLVQPYSDSPVDDENVSKNVYLDLITQAQETLWITTPYLILDNATMTALRLAAKRGVDVRIYTPGIPDKKMVYQLTCSYFEPLIRSGVKIYTFTPGFLHAKTWLVDGRIAVVGSINLDYRSLYLHFECAALLYGCAALADVGEFMMQLEKQSHLVELKECRTSAPGLMVSALLRLLAPLC